MIKVRTMFRTALHTNPGRRSAHDGRDPAMGSRDQRLEPSIKSVVTGRSSEVPRITEPIKEIEITRLGASRSALRRGRRCATHERREASPDPTAVQAPKGCGEMGC